MTDVGCESRDEDAEEAPTRFQVLVRFRPLIPWERSSGGVMGVVHFPSRHRLVIDSPYNSSSALASRDRRRLRRSRSSQHLSFGFDRVFPPSTSQQDLYRELVPVLVPHILRGRYHVSLLAYGPTSAGKTYTMFQYPDRPHGVCPRLVTDLFDGLDEPLSNGRVSISVSMFEIYMEKVIDLLAAVDEEKKTKKNKRIRNRAVSADLSCDSDHEGRGFRGFGSYLRPVSPQQHTLFQNYVRPTTSTGVLGGRRVRFLRVVENSDGGGFEVPGIKTVVATRREDVFEAIRVGNENKNLALSQLGAESSRSHTVLRITLSWVVDGDCESGDEEEEEDALGCWKKRRMTRLNLIDLAGSENVSRTKAMGVRLQEAKKINHSLSVLGKVLRGLRQRSQHVPFRESKLTMLLKSDLSGDCVTCFILNCSPCSLSVHETLSTLRFGEACLQVGIRPTVGRCRLVLPSDVRELQGIVVRQREEIEKLKTSLDEESAKSKDFSEQPCSPRSPVLCQEAPIQQVGSEKDDENLVGDQHPADLCSKEKLVLWNECLQKDSHIFALQDEISELRHTLLQKEIELLDSCSRPVNVPDFSAFVKELSEIRTEVEYLLTLRRLRPSSRGLSRETAMEDASLVRILALCKLPSLEVECAPGYHDMCDRRLHVQLPRQSSPEYQQIKCGALEVLFEGEGKWEVRWAVRVLNSFKLYDSISSLCCADFVGRLHVEVKPRAGTLDMPSLMVVGRLRGVQGLSSAVLRIAEPREFKEWLEALTDG